MPDRPPPPLDGLDVDLLDRYVSGECSEQETAVVLAYVARRDTTPRLTAQPRLTYVTAVRERSELRLPDGTRVRLAPASKLRVATDFGVERRDVYLDGEAYFEVVHDEMRPFT